MSPIPAIWHLPASARAYNDLISGIDQRIDDGIDMVMLEAIKIVREELMAKAPVLADKMYPKRLKISLLPGGDGLESVAVIYFEKVFTEIGGTEENLAIFIKPRRNSPEHVKVLAQYSPWPAKLLPTKVESHEASVISRVVTQNEMTIFRNRVIRFRSKIESELRSAGLRDIKIEDSASAKGTQVIDDLGHQVLRQELGIGAARKPHWRPAINAMKKRADKLQAKFVEYVLTGKKSQFDLPDVSDSIQKQEMLQGAWFQDKIAPLV